MHPLAYLTVQKTQTAAGSLQPPLQHQTLACASYCTVFEETFEFALSVPLAVYARTAK